MSANTLGTLFSVTTFGESHGPAIGCVIDGCPPGLELKEEDIQPFLDKRKPGQSKYTTQRREEDKVQILSGVFEGKTTGAPVALLIQNTDQRSRDYQEIKDLFRPGHADFTYHYKYGHRDYRGGGRSSARETAVNWGSRSVSGFINFASMGVVGDYLSSLYKFDNEFYNKLAGGATAGVIASYLTTIPNSYGDRKLLSSHMENNRLLTVTPYTMFSQMKSHTSQIGLKAALILATTNFMKEVLARSPQSALAFGMIFGLDHLLGPEPLKRVWPNRSSELEADKAAVLSPQK